VVALLRYGAPGALPTDAVITPADVDDPHVGALTPVLDADWVVRVGERDVVHVEHLCGAPHKCSYAERSVMRGVPSGACAGSSA
jgi:hypothetical protein